MSTSNYQPPAADTQVIPDSSHLLENNGTKLAVPGLSGRLTHQTRHYWAVAATFFVLALIGRAPDLFHHYRDWDEAAMMSQAWAMTRGEVLYRDIFQIHPPLNLVYFIPFFWTLAPSQVPHAVKALNIILVGLNAFLVYYFCAAWLRDRAVALAAGASFLFMTSNRFLWTQSTHGEFLIIFPLAASACLLFLRRTDRLASFSVGALWATAFFLKQVALVDCLFLLGVSIVSDLKSGHLLWRRLAAIVAGFSTVLTVMIVWLTSQGALSEATHSIFMRTLANYVGGSTARWSAEPFWRLFLEFPLFCAAAAVVGVGVLYNRGVAGRTRALGVGSCGWALAVLTALSSAGRFYSNYLLQVILPLCVASSLVLVFMKPRVRRVAAAAVVAAFAVAMSLSSWSALATLSRLGWQPEEVRRGSIVAEFLRERTGAEDRIFLYRVLDLNIFFLSERLSSNGIYMYVDMTVEHMHDTALAEEMQQRLLRRPPRAIVASRSMALGFASNERFFWPLIDRCYRQALTVGRVKVYLRKEGCAGNVSPASGHR